MARAMGKPAIKRANELFHQDWLEHMGLALDRGSTGCVTDQRIGQERNDRHCLRSDPGRADCPAN